MVTVWKFLPNCANLEKRIEFSESNRGLCANSYKKSIVWKPSW